MLCIHRGGSGGDQVLGDADVPGVVSDASSERIAEHAITRTEALDVLPDLLNDARRLPAQNEREVLPLNDDSTLASLHIPQAHACRLDANQHLVGAWCRHGQMEKREAF